MKVIRWIFIGYFNLLMSYLRILNKDKRELYNQRYNICIKCEHINKKIELCKMCGCFVIAKTKIDEAFCPKKFW